MGNQLKLDESTLPRTASCAQEQVPVSPQLGALRPPLTTLRETRVDAPYPPLTTLANQSRTARFKDVCLSLLTPLMV